MYKRLHSVLLNTRKNLWDVCRELNIDPKLLELQQLELDQCNHCGLWLKPDKLIEDLDHNHVCGYCRDLTGL